MKKSWLYIVTTADSLELPVMVTEHIEDVAKLIGKSVARTKWFFYPSATKRREEWEKITRNLTIPYRFIRMEK